MIKLQKAVIVEGKYDKIKLENIIDAVIIPTNGFRIFKDAEKSALIRKIALKKGIVIITDSDSAGNMIRSHLKKIVGEADIINVYLPQILGKERRKAKPSAEGFLGVEGTDDDIILKTLEKYGLTSDKAIENMPKATKTDLYKWGLSGRPDSAENRISLLKHLHLPQNLTANALLDALNSLYNYSELSEVIFNWQQDLNKN